MLLAAPEKKLIVPYSDIARDPDRFGVDPDVVAAAIVAGIGEQHDRGKMNPVEHEDVRTRLGWVALSPRELGTLVLGYVSLTAPNGGTPSRVSSLWAVPGHKLGGSLVACATQYAVDALRVTPDALCRSQAGVKVFETVDYREAGRTPEGKTHMRYCGSL